MSMTGPRRGDQFNTCIWLQESLFYLFLEVAFYLIIITMYFYTHVTCSRSGRHFPFLQSAGHSGRPGARPASSWRPASQQVSQAGRKAAGPGRMSQHARPCIDWPDLLGAGRRPARLAIPHMHTYKRHIRTPPSGLHI